jgi:hypothetical protein
MALLLLLEIVPVFVIVSVVIAPSLAIAADTLDVILPEFVRVTIVPLLLEMVLLLLLEMVPVPVFVKVVITPPLSM